MKSSSVFFIGFLFFDVVALAWGAWELWSVRRDKAAPRQPADDLPPTSEEGAGHPERQHGADDRRA